MVQARVLSALIAERDRRKNKERQRFAKYLKNPVGFVDEALLGFLWSKQRTICESVRDNRRTAVPSCHDVGKSAMAARIAAWWLSVHEPGEAFVVTLAPTFHQVRAILWREIKRVHASGGLPGKTNTTEWWLGPELVGFGRSPKDTDPTAIQGIHARYVLVIFDEACGISKDLWDAADSLIANEDSRFLAIGNPDDSQTEFFEVCKPNSGWTVIPLSAFDSPNFTGEPVPDWLRPLLISRTWQVEKLKKWGEQSPIYKAKVLGQFSEQATDALISIKDLTRAVDRGLEAAWPDKGIVELGVDVARFGGDASVCYAKRLDVAKRMFKDYNRDTMHLVGRVVVAIRETGARRVKIDDIGVGGGVTDRLHELQGEGKLPQTIEIVGVNVGESPRSNLADERFKNLRAEINWGMHELFSEGRIVLLKTPDDDTGDLVSQAQQIKYKYTSTGEIQIEAKADMKKRTKGISPDDWDALVLACSNPQTGAEAWLKFMEGQVSQVQGQPAAPSNEARPWQAPAPPKPTDQQADMAAFYEQTLKEFMGVKPQPCRICGKPLAASKVSDGVEAWHVPGDPECRR